ncbi:hypothetical protein [Sorangium cellulosum]|uniref:hypothetical protein n=1 Tax=Sorangium cellulosum TaxID=56 RepID=UPI0012FF66DE|nr:hypothetical protein [Sorangium cellulosum]
MAYIASSPERSAALVAAFQRSSALSSAFSSSASGAGVAGGVGAEAEGAGAADTIGARVALEVLLGMASDLFRQATVLASARVATTIAPVPISFMSVASSAS